jgi:hypothetical protein
MVAVVVAAVLELLADSPADFDLHGRCDRDVALVEQRVQVAAEEDSVADEVHAGLRMRLDVSCIERRERALASSPAGNARS